LREKESELNDKNSKIEELLRRKSNLEEELPLKNKEIESLKKDHARNLNKLQESIKE